MWQKRAVMLWRIRMIALCVLLCALLIPPALEYPPVWLAVTLLIGLTAMACAYIRHYVSAFAIRFTPDQIDIQSGVFIRRHILLPRTDLILSDIRSTPIERRLGLCRVRIYGRGKVLRILCLPRTEAERLQPPPEAIP